MGLVGLVDEITLSYFILLGSPPAPLEKGGARDGPERGQREGQREEPGFLEKTGFWRGSWP